MWKKYMIFVKVNFVLTGLGYGAQLFDQIIV